jgi:hypothetical protein
MAKKLKIPEDALAFFRAQGARGGKMGASARIEKVSPERRREIARKAAAASAKVRTAKAAKKAAKAAED